MEKFTEREKFICAYAKESMLCACEMLRQLDNPEEVLKNISSTIEYLEGETITITSRWQMNSLFLTR